MAVVTIWSCRIASWVAAHHLGLFLPAATGGRLHTYRRDSICQTIYALTIAIAVVINYTIEIGAPKLG